MPAVQNPPEKMKFQLTLRRRGISDQAVLRAMEEIPRENFVEAADRGDAYRDSALGIACGQTISQPFVVAYMTEQLQLQKHHRVLEIGTGSGYQAAILSRLCGEVLTIERYRTLADSARARLAKLGCDNVEVMFGDGFDIPASAGAVRPHHRHRGDGADPRGAAAAARAGRYPDRAGRTASGHPDPGPRDQDRRRLRAQGAGRCALRAGAARASPANCKIPDRLSRQHLIRRVKRLFTGEVFTQNSILLRTSE